MARPNPEAFRRCVAYTFLARKAHRQEGTASKSQIRNLKPQKGAPPRETEKGLIRKADCKIRRGIRSEIPNLKLADPMQNRISPLAQASAPRAVSPTRRAATLDQPLIRAGLFYPATGIFGRRLGSGLCAARTPRLPRIRVPDSHFKIVHQVLNTPCRKWVSRKKFTES